MVLMKHRILEETEGIRASGSSKDVSSVGYFDGICENANLHHAQIPV